MNDLFLVFAIIMHIHSSDIPHVENIFHVSQKVLYNINLAIGSYTFGL